MRCRISRALALASTLLLLALVPAASDDTSNYENQRNRMVTLVEIQTLLTSEETGISELDPRIVEAMRRVPRHEFVPDALRELAYGDGPLPVGHNQNIASPYLVALMTQLADVGPGDVVYETGTGAGYHAALLSELGSRVFSIEVVEPLAQEVGKTLKRLGYDRVWARAGDGYYGWPEEGPFDAIIVKEAVDHVPPPLLDQLRPGGRMVLPLGPLERGQTLTVVEKDGDGRVRRTGIMPVIFSPLQGGQRT